MSLTACEHSTGELTDLSRYFAAICTGYLFRICTTLVEALGSQ
jgi:hypothetical protein